MANDRYAGDPLFGLEIGVENPDENLAGSYADLIDHHREILNSNHNEASPLSIGNPMPRGIGVSPLSPKWLRGKKNLPPEVEGIGVSPNLAGHYADLIDHHREVLYGPGYIASPPPEVEGIGVSPGTFVADQEPPLRETAVNSIVVGSNIADDQRSNEASREAVASLLAPESGGYSPLTGLDRLFAIMSGMGRRGGMSPLSDFLQSNVDLRTNEAAAMKNYQDRMIEQQKFNEEMEIKQGRLDVEKIKAASSKNKSKYIGQTQGELKIIGSEILRQMSEETIPELNAFVDERSTSVFVTSAARAAENERIANQLIFRVVEIYNKAVDASNPISFTEALRIAAGAATEPGDKSSGSANGIRSDSPVNVYAPIEDE